MPVSFSDTTGGERSGLAAAVSKTVAEDLDAIMPPAPQPARRKLRLGKRESAGPAREGRGKRAARVGAVVAAAFVGVSAGALLPRWEQVERTSKPAIAVTAAAGAPQLAIVAAPVVRPEPAPARLATLAAPPATAAAAARVRAPPVARRPVSSAGCASCGYDDVMAADARLRRAYGRAVRAGVSRSVLVDYRDDWSSLRRQAPRRPGRVVAGYSRMARELDQLAWTHRNVAYRPRREHGLRRLGAQLAALLP